jgi:hypothetical protein
MIPARRFLPDRQEIPTVFRLIDRYKNLVPFIGPKTNGGVQNNAEDTGTGCLGVRRSRAFGCPCCSVSESDGACGPDPCGHGLLSSCLCRCTQTPRVSRLVHCERVVHRLPLSALGNPSRSVVIVDDGTGSLGYRSHRERDHGCFVCLGREPTARPLLPRRHSRRPHHGARRMARRLDHAGPAPSRYERRLQYKRRTQCRLPPDGHPVDRACWRARALRTGTSSCNVAFRRRGGRERQR